MDSCLIAFLLGFSVCAVGILLALMFDVSLSWIGYFWNKIVPYKRKETDVG